jgi:type IV secretion system protein VirB9
LERQNVIRKLAIASALTAMLPALAMAQEIPAIQSNVDFEQIKANARAEGGNPSDGTPAEQGDPGSEVPRHMPTKVPVLSPQKPLTAKQNVGVRMASKWIKKAATPNMGEDGTVRFLYGQGEPTIVCAPLMVCDLALEPGEIVQPPLFLADKRWTAEPGVSGSGASRTTHVILKPSDVGLITNIVIQTNRRSYSIKLVSRLKDYMPLVAFDYPAERMERSWGQYAQAMAEETPDAAKPASVCDQPPSVPPSAFKIEGADVSWKPVQVFAVATPVGQKTCVQFPADMGSHMLPALVVLGPAKGWFSGPSMQPVNARFQNNHWIVDNLLDSFALVDGVGSAQQKITVERKK